MFTQTFFSVSKVINSIFDNGYVKFKNGMAWSDEVAAKKYHLRLLIGTGWFGNPKRRTMGQLRADPVAQREWNDYLNVEEVPAGFSRPTWKRQIELAQQWLCNVPDTRDMRMLCEVQMALKEYATARTAMHESYKVS